MYMSLILKNRLNNKKGFTLIELLVVIAIIGVLASVVLSSLNSARKKGQIVAIKSNLKNMIPQAELAYDGPGNYSTVCTDPRILSMLDSINNSGGTAQCYSFDNTSWAASAKLNSDSTQNFLVSSTGVVTWDSAYSLTSWSGNNTNCAAIGGRQPTIDELKSLSLVYGSVTPPGFGANYYFSSTTVTSDPTRVYGLNFNGGSTASTWSKTLSTIYGGCVR